MERDDLVDGEDDEEEVAAANVGFVSDEQPEPSGVTDLKCVDKLEYIIPVLESDKKCGEDDSSEDEEVQPTSGYDSDVPIVEDGFSLSRIVRASMRRMRHFRLSTRRTPDEPEVEPEPETADRNNNGATSSSHVTCDTPPVVQQPQQPVGLATTIGSPTTNGIIVTSLMNVLNAQPVPEPPVVPPTVPTVTTTPATPTSSEAPPSPPPVTRRTCDNTRRREDSGSETEGSRSRSSQQQENPPNSTEGLRSPGGQWPHHFGAVLAILGCTIGLFNLSRFAILSIEFGANFIIQFLILTILFGIPLLTFHMSLGQYLGSGIIDMWRISPIFQGVGVAIIASQVILGLYSVIGVSWMFIYFRDSFITQYDRYRWGHCLSEYRADCPPPQNFSGRLEDNVPDYFNGVVLQRENASSPFDSFGSVKFQVAFNLGVVWMLVFVCLSKGLKSYGKVVYGIVLLPLLGLLVMCSKLIGLAPSGRSTAEAVFGQTAWSDFFYNSLTWMAAAREVFFTWGLLGACAMQITAQNKARHNLRRDAAFIILLTLVLLLLTAFLANTCLQLLEANGYIYTPSSFETDKTYGFLHRVEFGSGETRPPVRNLFHTNFILGVRIQQSSSNPRTVSGYQALRLTTEIFPATVTMLGPQILSPFWTILFYFTFIMFGISQQLTIWHCVVSGFIALKTKSLKSWETTITFFACAVAFVLGLPLTTELGIFMVYFLDYVVGSAWWIMVAYLLQLVAVFVIRGSPYNSESIVTVLLNGPGRFVAITAPLLSFTWNVILPVALLVLAITSFKNGNFRDMFDWNSSDGYIYWQVWVRELGCLLQILPLLLVPLIGIIQSCRYLTTGPPDIFDRIALLYRPSVGSPVRRTQRILAELAVRSEAPRGTQSAVQNDDPPPKYTPPPSYSTATGARIAKLLRQSFRRSMRRLQLLGDGGTLGAEGSSSSASSSQNVSSAPSGPGDPTVLPPPPDYSTVILEMQRSAAQDSSSCPASSTTTTSNNITPAEITQLLRTSMRRSTRNTLNRNLRRISEGDTNAAEEASVDGVRINMDVSASVI